MFQPRRRRGVLIEVCLAAAILLVVTVATGGGSPSSTSPSASALAAWGRGGIPAITNLIDDLQAIELGTTPATPEPAWRAALDRAASQLRVDLAGAQKLAAPPNRTVAAAWTQTLGLLARGEHLLDLALADPDPTTLAQAHQQFATAGGELLEVGQAIQLTG